MPAGAFAASVALTVGDGVDVIEHRQQLPCPAICLPAVADVGTTAGREIRIAAKLPARDPSGRASAEHGDPER
jgi:hypothetical protein